MSEGCEGGRRGEERHALTSGQPVSDADTIASASSTTLAPVDAFVAYVTAAGISPPLLACECEWPCAADWLLSGLPSSWPPCPWP